MDCERCVELERQLRDLELDIEELSEARDATRGSESVERISRLLARRIVEFRQTKALFDNHRLHANGI